jgi:hypothetical protein
METIQLSYREMLFLSDLLGSTQTDIKDELSEIIDDLELDNLRIEMHQDIILCDSIRGKLESAMQD